MANVLKHRFISAKADGGDPSQIQPSNWNDGHTFSGGNAGEILTRDPADALYGAVWAPYKTNMVVGATYGSGEWVGANFGGKSTYIQWIGPGVDTSLSGISGGVAGQTLTIRNESPAHFLTFNAMDPASAAPNRFLNFVTVGPTRIGVSGAVTYVHDGTHWVLISHVMGQWYRPAPNPADFLTAGGGTWTVEGADILSQAYVVHGRTMTYSFSVVNTAVTGPAPQLVIKIPAGHLSAIYKLFITPMVINDVGGAGFQSGFVQVDSTGGVGASTFGLIRTSGSWPTTPQLNLFLTVNIELQ